MAQDLFDLSSVVAPGTGDSLFGSSVLPAPTDSRTAFQRNYVNFADPAVPDSYPAFTRSRDLMTLDTDPTGERTRQWAERTGNPAAGELVQGLNVFGRAMGRDRLMSTEAGRQLLEIAEKNRKGVRRGFWESLFDVSLEDLPFVGMLASVGGSIADAVTVSDTMRKLQDGEAVTDDELVKTRLYMAKQERDANGTWGATVGGIIRAAPGFMVEMFASGGLLTAARVGLTKAGVGGARFALTRATKTLAREAIETEAERVVTSAVGRAAGKATAAEIAGLAGSDAGKGVVRAVTDQLFRFMKSADASGMYKAFSDDALMEMAKGRAQRELSNLVARRGGTAVQNGFHSFAQWFGRHASAGLLDFGTFGTEEATVLFTRQTTAGRALADALGVLTVEAPLKGTMLMLPKKAVEQAAVAPLLGQDGRVVGRNQLSLQYSALVSGNRRLMDNAEAAAFGMDLLEYISENTGAGFKSALAAGGIGLEKLGVRGLVRPVETAISPLGANLPTTGAEGYGVGGIMRRFVQKALGTREGFAQKVAGMETDLVAKRLGLSGAEREAIASAVRTGSTATLRPELRAAVGDDIARFVKETVDLAFKQGEKDLQYKTYARYAAAKWMQKHGIGPETAMNLFRQMGYDGVLGEMFEERYSDVVQGLLGMGDRADTVSLVPGTESPEAASFLNNVKEAVKGLYPGWDQLTAEAVGFMFPMVTRGLTMRAMSAIGGGGELAQARATLGMLDDAMRHNTVGEMTYSDAEAAFAFAREADAAEVRSLTERLAQARAAGDAVAAEGLERELATRAQVAQRRAERQKVFMDSVDEAAKATAGALIAVPLDTYGTLSSRELADRAPVLTEAEARQVLDSQRALGDFASQLARQIVEGQLPLEGESENMFRKLARRLVGVAGFLATGDFSLTAANAAQWTARDMGLSKKVVDALQTGFRAELTRTRDDMYAKETDRAKAEGRAPAAIPAKEVLDEAQRRFDLRARQIMTANLAVHQLRSFTDGRLREEAAQLWARKHVDSDGRAWQYAVDAEGRGVFYKLSEDGKGVDPVSRKPLAELYGEHAEDIDRIKRDILKATVDIMARRLTGSDAGRNAVLSAVSLDAGSDMLDIALYDAAMHMIGAQDLVYRVSLDGRTPLRSVMESRSVARVSDEVVGYIASKAAFEDVDGIAYESVAQALGLRFDGTEEGLRARNEKIFRMAKLMRLHRREGNLYFSREILEEESDEARMSSNGTSTLVAERQPDGTYRVDFGAKKDNPKERDVRIYKSEASVFGAMLRRGYARDATHTILTQAKVIESSDMFWMIRELGLARDYYDRLGPRGDAYTHPAFRHGADGKFLPLDDFEDEKGATRPGAETILRQELAAAARGKLPGASIADQRMYERLFGENGYMAVGEKLLADRGIHKDTLLPYTGEFHDYAPSRYTYLMSAGRISPKSADTYVVVDPHDQADITSGLVNAVLLHAFARNGALLRDTLAGTVSDFVKDVRAIAKDALAEARAKKDTGLASQLETFLRTCCDDVDRIVVEGGREVKRRGIGLSAAGFVTLANAFGLFRAREDATSPMLRALATIAPRVWNAPSFLGFEGLLNVTLGGNFFDTAVWSAKPGGKDYVDPALTGVPQVMALASGNASALRDAVKSSLPAGLGYEQFLDAVMAQLAAQSKTGGPGVTEDEKAELRARARAAASDKAKPEEHFTFLGGLVSVLKAAIDRGITTSTSVPDFLTAVLESVANDPNTTDRQRQAAAKQLDFLRRRDAANEAEDAYVKTRNDLAEKETAQREQLKEARDGLDAARQRSVDLDRRALAGESVAEEERQDARTKVADATAAVETAAQALVKTQEERAGVPAPEGLHALNQGGDTKEAAEAVDLDPGLVDEVYDEGSADDDSFRAGGAATDVPDVFAADAARREDGFTTDNGSVMDETEHRLNRRQANLVAGTVLRSVPADDIGEDAFAARLAEMFPHMVEAERADVVDAFRRLDMKRLTAGHGWGDVIVSGRHFGFPEDDKADEDRSSDNFNERALAEYNSESMVDLSEVLKRVAPESKGSVMGFIDMLRGRLRVRDAGAVGQDLLSGIVNPQLTPGMKNLAQADALHKQTLARLADADVTAVVDALVKEDPQAAFLLSYMTSLPVNARTRFAGLCSGSVAAMPIEVRDGRAAACSNTPDGKVPDRLITATFDGLVGMSPRRLGKLAGALRADMDALDVDAFDGSDDLGKLKANAAKVARVIARRLGRNNPLYTALTSHIAHRAWAVTEYRKAQLESVTRTKGRDRDGAPATKVDALAVIIDAVEQLASRGREPTREDVESMFVAAFTMGGFRSVGLKRPMTHLDVTDPLLTFLNLFQAALPRVMMRARIDQERERAAGSVVVAPRGMVPLLSRWMYQEGEGSFAEICRATWPGVTDEQLAECRQDGTWPDDAKTPVCAKCVSTSLTPREVYRACRDAYKESAVKWVPIYSGDHASFTLLQVPAEVDLREAEAGLTGTVSHLVEPGVTTEFDGRKVVWEKSKGKHRSFAWFDRKTDTIHVSAEDAKETFAKRAWEKPERSDPLPSGVINSLEDLIDFAVAHEAAHAKLPPTKVKQADGTAVDTENARDIENQANATAIERMRSVSASAPLVKVVFPGNNPHKAKDEDKFNSHGGITKFIGFGPGSTGLYANVLSKIANTGVYSASDIVGVSVNGKRKDRVPVRGTEVEQEVRKAAEAGALIITDTSLDRARDYNVGERELAELLEELGYEEASGTGWWQRKDLMGQPAAWARRAADAQAPVEKPTYKSFAKAAYKAIGMDLMFTDTKRSAISSLEAQGTGLVGVDAQGNYGEHRVHIVHSWVPGTKNDAFLGSTFMHGYGSRMVGDMSADPDSNTKKVHVIGGAGRDLFFIKSLAITQNGLRGKFREGSAPRAVFDYLEKFRGNDDLSTDTLTDDDSYKIGPGNSKSLRVVNNGGDATVMEYVFGRLLARLVEAGVLKPGYSQDDLAKVFKLYDRMTGDELDEAVGAITVKDLARGTTTDMKLSEIMPGAMVNAFEGWSGPALDLSYREDSAMAYTVANVAHKSSLPAEAGRAPRNYEVDALAMVRTLAAGGWLKTPGVARGLHELMGRWGLLSASVYAHPKFREAMLQMDENLAELARNGEFVSERGTFSGQNAVAEMTRQIMAKARRAANLPMQGIDAPLVSAGASVDGDGNLVVHTSSAMERDMLKGSELFSDDERAFYGTNRRLALCNVNVSSNGFRYGWFLADDAEAKYPEAYQQGDRSGRAAGNAERRHACAIAWAAKRVRDLTKKAGAKDAKEEDKQAALEARVKFASMFVDHHGTSISEYGARYLSLYSVEDLFIPSNGDVEDFDYSAVQCEGQDTVFNDATKKRHVFLGGTMFGLPRTPSYNGSMWLQTVRAGLPVTEEETDNDRGWRVGADAMVSPDPYTNAILGCDHDGDKTKLYMFSVNASGGVTFSDLPGVNVPVDQFKERRFEYLQECWRRGCLERVRLDESGNEVQVGLDEQTEDSYYRISEPLRRQVSNSFVRALFSMSRQLPVDLPVDLPGGQVTTTARETPGANDARPRQKFLGGVASSETKAFPLRGKDAKKAFLRDHALPEVIKPDGSNGTLGDPELAMELASSAEDAGDARGVMVSLARSLHLAWALGLYSTDAKKPGDRGALLGPMTGVDWLRFMYHVDGLSNATFDDIKEQVCGRLGWTKGMMDTVLTELLMYPDRMPKTDEEFARILGRYGDDIRKHGMRYWMLRNSRVDDDEAHRIVCKSFVPGRRRFTKANFMSSLGLETVVKEGGNGEYTALEMTSKLNTLGTAVGRALAGMKGSLSFVDMAGRDAGRNPALGMLHYIVSHALAKSGHGDAVSDDRTLDLTRSVSGEEAGKVTREVVAALAKNGVARWTERRGLLLEARSVGACLNYLTADPGAPTAERTRKQNADAYKPFAEELTDTVADGRIPRAVVEQMRLATDLMYDVGRDLYTVTARAVSAAQNRGRLLDETLQRLPESSAAVGRLMAKDTVSSWDLMGLEGNQQQVPLLAEFFSGAVDDLLGRITPGLSGHTVYDMLSKFADNIAANPVPRAKAAAEALNTTIPGKAAEFLGKFGGASGMRSARPLVAFMQNKASAAPSLEAAQGYDAFVDVIRTAFTPKVLAMRAAVESMLYICSDLMTTSETFKSDEMNRATAFLRMAPDRDGFGRQTRSYGQIAAELSRVMPQFRANDRGSLEKIRAMFDRIISGEAFGPGSRRQLVGEDERRAEGLATQRGKGGRQLTADEWDRTRAWTRAWSFTLSRRTLLEYAREYTNAPSTVTLETWSDIESKLSFPDERGRQVKMHLQHVWDALGDDKTEVTPAVLFGALLPAYTLATSRQKGVPDENSLSLLTLLPQRYYSALSAAEALRRRGGDTVVPLMVGSVWAPETWQPDLDLLADDSAVDWSSPDLLQNGVQNERGGVSDETRDSLRGGAGRREYRRNPHQSNTVDIFDPAFEAALGALRDSPSASAASLPPATTAGHLGAGAYDANAAKLATAAGALFGSWAKVEYNGGKVFTIRGDLRGMAGTGKAVSIVVDTSTSPLLDSEEDVARLANSSAYAASFVEVLGESLGLSSAEQFLRLPKEVRQALVRKYGVGGATSSKVAWSFGAKGAATLVGRISVPAGGTTLYHEYFHQMMRMFESFSLLGNDDYEALRSTFGDDPSGRHRFNEEAAAEAFRRWVEGNSDAKADSARGVFRRIYDFLKGFLAALMRGFSYADGDGAETLFRMVVHGIAQPSSERIGEAQVAAATAGAELRARLLRSGRLDSDTVDAWVENKERSIRDRQFRLPKAPKASRAELEAQAAQQKPQAAQSAGFMEIEEYDDGTHLAQEELDRSNALAAELVKRIDDPGSTAETIAFKLYGLVQLREQMAAELGLGTEPGQGVARPDDGGEDFAPMPVDPDKAEVDRLVSPLVDNSLFYRTANFIRQSLEDGLRGTGAWSDNLEYVVKRYRANDAQSAQDEALRKTSILHGLRRALAQVNPEAAASLSNADVENSLAYRAALVMYQHLESSYLNGRTAGQAPVDGPARHASRYNVSAWILSTMPSAPADTVRQARSRIEELYKASPSGASKAELKLHLDQMDALMEVVGDQTGLSQFRRGGSVSVFDDVIGTLRAGTEAHGVDESGVLKDITPVQAVDGDGNPTTLNPRSRAHLKTFQQSHGDPAVQESLKLALTTAYQVSAMAKYYGDLDIHPAPRGDLAEAKRLARLNGIPAHMSSLEFLGEHLVGDSNMVDNPAYVDYACQSHFIAQNVDAWLRSMVRDGFGAHEGLGRMMSDEHFEYQGLVNAVTMKENWIAHMLGVSLEPGGHLLEAVRQKGEYRMENGDVVRRVDDGPGEFLLDDGTTVRARLRVNDEYTLSDGRKVTRSPAGGYVLDGKPVQRLGEFVKFDNYGRRVTSVKLTEEDIRRVDMWLKMCSAHFNGQTSVVTGVDDISFYRQLSREPADYSIEAVTAKRDRKEHLNPLELAVWRMTRQVPPDLLPKVHGAFVRNVLEALSRADAMMDEGTHVRGRYGTEETPAVHDAATYNSFVIGQLVRSGTVVGYNPGGAVHQGGLPRYENAALLISCDDIDAGFQGSETYQKLVKAGRDPSWLTRKFVVDEFRGVWDDTVRFVKRHPWLTHGDGQYFHAFGTALPFWRGSGVFMYNAVRTDRQNRITPSDRMSEAEATLQRIMESADADRTLAELGDARVVDDADKLARFIGARHRAAQFLQDIRDGLYEIGGRDSVETGVVIHADATYADLAKAFYDKARQLMWSSFTGYSDAAPRPELEDVIARYENTRLERGEVFGGSIGFKDTDMFRMHGTLPANYQIGHKVHKCIDGITNAMMSRATLANLLLTPEGSTGAPVYYADPSEIAAEASGLPDEFWGNLAEWWQAHNPDVGQVYDPARSGVQNAKEVYKAIRENHQVEGKKAKFAVGSLGYTELPGDDSTLVSVDHWMVLDGNGEDFMNATAGGEAMGYLKHFLDAGKVLGLGGAGVRAAIQRALSYSKSLSVSFSLFFPMATRWESPMGAVGAMSTIGSNWKWVGDWMKEHPDAANMIRGMFGGKAWITHDFIGMKDIVRMMDSNDPFLAELYSWAAALGITVSTSVTNPMEPDKTVLLKDIRRMKDAVRHSMGADAAGKFARTMDALLVRQGDKAFNYVLNATKLAVVAQMCMKLRHQAKSQGKAFDPVRDLRKYSRYINAEIGGIDPMQFAWAHPKARQLMNMALFSWQWTVGAWQAGGGSVLTDMLTGSRTMTRQERAYFAGRWMRMFLGVMVGVPALFQVVTRLLAKAIRGVAGLPDDDDDDKWGTWQNEDKARWTAFDLTPLLRAVAEADETKLGGVLRRYKEGGGLGTAVAGALAGGVLGGLNGGNWLTGLIGGAVGAGTGALVPGLVPLYTGGDAANQTTRQRRYYMHFGKQGWEFFRWFDDAKGQFFSKLSMPTQRVMEGIMGRSLGFLERSLPWEEQGQFERWLSPTTDSALFNIAEAFLPFSVGGINRNGDAGFLPIFGPVQMGASQTAVQKQLVAALEKWAANDRRGYAFGRAVRGGKRAGKPYAQVADILRDAERNGLDPHDMLDKACGQVMREYYGRLFRELPEHPGDEVDAKKVAAIARALYRLGGRKANAVQSMKDRYEKTGRKWDTLPREVRSQARAALGDAFTNPFDY